MTFFNKQIKKWFSLFLIFTFVSQLILPSVVYADSSQPKAATENSIDEERFDKKLLTKIGKRIQIILETICSKVSENPDNDVKIRTYLIDKRHRIFTDIEGTIIIRYPSLIKKSIKKFEGAVGQCLSTNGPISLDFSVREFTKINDKAYRLSFKADLVITLKEVIRHTLMQALDLFGAFAIGSGLAKTSKFFDSVHAEKFATAIGEGLKTLWALGSGKIAYDTYEMLDTTGHFSLKELLTKTVTIKSVVYHFGAFILKGGVEAGASLAKLSLGAAIGASLAGQIGTFIGAALAAAAISIIGSIIVEKLTITMPMVFRLRGIRKLQKKIAIAEDNAELENELLNKLEEKEVATVGFLKDEILLDRYSAFQVFIDKMKEAKENNILHLYEGVLTKAKNQLQISAVHDENWNAARYYYQLLKAIDQLPVTSMQQGEN